ncbi:hypothetical protein BCV70DRAFT_107167 [Testicularia cyperi]|uniref:Cytochrome b561 domain-containing protein n=1 Tax=Testicularia cyperi TaxID=1882483 RepID=A0A317XQ62_9BASI|nr:hypothetical protein BCV70DRAFT_107167 [Testicularia cyperi]
MSHADSSTTPLLPSSSDNVNDTSHTATTSPRPADMVKQENLSRSAVPVQAAALLFVALVWSIVFSTMSPWALPLFGYHPIIQSFTILLMLQGVIVLQKTSLQKSREEKAAAFQVHQWINVLLVLPLFTAGATIMWYLHDQPNSKHFISWHGILGTTVVVWAWVQAAVGAASVWLDGMLLGGPNKAKSMYKWHRLSGYLLLPLFLLTAALGVAETTWAKQNSTVLTRYLVGGALAFAGAALIGRADAGKLPSFGSRRS